MNFAHDENAMMIATSSDRLRYECKIEDYNMKRILRNLRCSLTVLKN